MSLYNIFSEENKLLESLCLDTNFAIASLLRDNFSEYRKWHMCYWIGIVDRLLLKDIQSKVENKKNVI